MHLRQAPLTVGLCVLLATPAAAHASASHSTPQPAPAPASTAAAQSGTGLSAMSTGHAASGSSTLQTEEAAAACLFYTKGDYAHRSSTGFAASAHGWWTNVNCSARTARVQVWLQQYYSDGVWRTRGYGDDTWPSGGGAGNRTTARANCADSRTTGWRSIVDVDLIGQIDSPERLVTPAQNIACRRA